MSNFAFLSTEFPTVHAAATEAERQAIASPTAAAFFAGKTVEVAVKWAFKNDPGLRLPYQDQISALLHEPSFRRIAGDTVFIKAKLINRVRNRAVHEEKTISAVEAAGIVKELFHVCFWFARTYARRGRPADGLAFDPKHFTRRDDAVRIAYSHIQRQQAELQAKDGELTKLLARGTELDAELVRLRAEVEAARKANSAAPDHHDYGEAETRDRFIDLLLREAGWALDRPEDVEFQIAGMPNPSGIGFVDYVLWGADGKPLGIVEAKATKRSPQEGKQQAKLYADALEKQFGQRPVIFLTNGYKHEIWDDLRYPSRPIDGFYKRDELELTIQRRTSSKSLAAEKLNLKIAGRPYQQRAIRAIAKSFDEDMLRKALLVMATGSGKTRTVIALVDLLMRAGWVKRVLFLADRKALVKQAANTFKEHLPDSAPVNLVTEKTKDGRVFLSTYPTMLNLIDGKAAQGKRTFGPGHFDLVVIDEAHRSVYDRYGAIFEYFDSFLVGLTATPREDVGHDTYALFGLKDGVPTDAYTLAEAVKDGHLVPPQAIAVPLKIIRSGLRYDDLSESEKGQWEALDWGEEQAPDSVDASEINKRLFNEDTIDRVIAHFMEKGVKVEGGDRIGKTIIFAKNQAHAEFIERRFDAAFPKLKGHFARIITYETRYADTLIDSFSEKNKEPQIAISVDMLDTGIDVPEVVNLVFFKMVRSKTKFWQMIGRGTRLCPDLFGPGDDKTFFRVFDYCGNLEFFGSDLELKEPSVPRSLSERMFAARLDLVRALDAKNQQQGGSFEAPPPINADGNKLDEAAIRQDAVIQLRETIAGMNLDSFMVRQRRGTVEKYLKLDSWITVDDEARKELVDQVAPLPSAKRHGTEEAKRFDLLMFSLQLALLKGSKRFQSLRKDLEEIVSALDGQTSIPGIAAQAELIEAVQTKAWWEGVTVSLLELVRLRLRDLVHHIEKGKRKILYTDFADEIGEDVEHSLPQVGEVDFVRFKQKARSFLRKHGDHIVLHRLRQGKPLTATDLAVLEQMLLDAGIGDEADINRARETSDGFGRFVRSLVGLDRQAVAVAFGSFLSDGSATRDQIEFIDLVIEHLTKAGAVEPSLLYESPFTDIAPQGPEQLFDESQTNRLFKVIDDMNQSAVA